MASRGWSRVPVPHSFVRIAWLAKKGWRDCNFLYAQGSLFAEKSRGAARKISVCVASQLLAALQPEKQYPLPRIDKFRLYAGKPWLGYPVVFVCLVLVKAGIHWPPSTASIISCANCWSWEYGSPSPPALSGEVNRTFYPSQLVGTSNSCLLLFLAADRPQGWVVIRSERSACNGYINKTLSCQVVSDLILLILCLLAFFSIILLI